MAIGQDHALKALNLDKIRFAFARKASENLASMTFNRSSTRRL